MKNSILLLLLIFSVGLHSQSTIEPITCVTYKVGLISNEAIDTINRSIIQQKKLDTRNAAINVIEYELFCTKDKSIYHLVDKLDLGNAFEYKMASIAAGRGLYYKDSNVKEKIKQIDSGGLCNIIYPYDEYVWKVTDETKIISGYKCYKAICVYGEFDHRRNKQLTFNPEVWFAPEIPIPFGPRGLDGLPGLVLEATFNSRIYFYATKIEFDVKNSKIKIERPSSGKYLTKKEYEQEY